MPHFLYPDNRLFVTGKTSQPVNLDEISKNVSRVVSEIRTSIGCFAFTAVVMAWLVFNLCVGLIVSQVLGFGKQDDIIINIGRFIVLPLSIYGSLYLFRMLREFAKVFYHSKPEVFIVQEMVKNRKLIEGKILGIVVEQENKITFSFQLDDKTQVKEYIFDVEKIGINIKTDFDVETDTVAVLIHPLGAVLL